MEIQSFTDLGVAGLLIFMTFQYVIKPLVGSVVGKIKGTNGHGHNPGPEVHKILEILSKRDDKDRYVVWGFWLKEELAELTKAITKLTEELRRTGQ